MIKTQILGYPRIGEKREIKKACESYWKGKISKEELLKVGKEQRYYAWNLQKKMGIDIIPSNDFSFYDQVLDMSFALGCIPKRYLELGIKDDIDLYFAMARGYQKDGKDVKAMEMTKWFNTNYHYIVPEFYPETKFKLNPSKIIGEFREAKELNINTKPVLIGPMSFLLLGKGKYSKFNNMNILDDLIDKYIEILKMISNEGAKYVQIDEPFLVMDLSSEEKTAYKYAFDKINKEVDNINIIIATYFDKLDENLDLALSLSKFIHIDLADGDGQLDDVLISLKKDTTLSLGVINGRNIWKNNFKKSLYSIKKAKNKLGSNKIIISTSCSLLHCPFDLDLETDSNVLKPELKEWICFSKQKLEELISLSKIAENESSYKELLSKNKSSISKKDKSDLIHTHEVKERVANINEDMLNRKNNFEIRRIKQHEANYLPLFPTTTIGSFPQTKEIRKIRLDYKKNIISKSEYEDKIKDMTKEVIRWQEDIGLDVLVHGEYERNDMVEHFAQFLDGYAFTENGWVQSYGSRCVKPPIIFGDITRTNDMTVNWIKFAKDQTSKPVKGMLTGPITMLRWSFVRDDQPEKDTSFQLALAIREEVKSLEKNGINVIQIDEPALREGLPLKNNKKSDYFDWAIKSFKLSSCVVSDETQIHTHMCYSEFNGIIEEIANLDADVITIESSRSEMEILEAFNAFNYPNEIGPGVYDIHSPRIPSVEEMKDLIKKATNVISFKNIWVNPDCGLKTRDWKEVKQALTNMVDAAKLMRNNN